MTVSKEELYLLAKNVEWQYKLDEYTDNQLKTILSITEKSQKELTATLSKATITEWSEERTNKLLSEIQTLQTGVKASITEGIADASSLAGSAAYDAHSTILSFSGAATAVVGASMTAETLKSIIVKTPVGGNLLSEWVDKSFTSNLQDKIKKEIAAGLINGDSYRAITKRLSEGFPGTKREIETLTRTYVASVNSQAMQDVYAANSDIIKNVQWRAAMSNRTCLRCAGLDGHKYKVEDHPPIPLHPRCRCVLIPIVDKTSLGLSKSDVQKAARPYSIREGKIVGLGGKGKAIDAGTWAGNYDSWLKSLTPQQQKDFLGPRRLELIQSGNISFEDLVDRRTGRIRTLDELSDYKAKKSEFGDKVKMGMAAKKAEEMSKMALAKSMKESAEKTAAGIAKAAVEKAAEDLAIKLADKVAKEMAEKIAKEAAEKAVKDALDLSMKAAAVSTKKGIESSIIASVEQKITKAAVAEKASRLLAEKIAKDKAFSDKVKAGMLAKKLEKETIKKAAKATKKTTKVEQALAKEKMLDGGEFKLYKSQAGSNEGGFYEHKVTGEKYYFKFPKTEAHVDNEILAGKLYKAAGVDVPDLLEVKMDGRRGVASRIIDDLKENKSAITSGKYTSTIEENMAVDAWLANWDVVGTGYNNLVMKGNRAVRVDVGGSLLYRARGGPKSSAFGKTVGELETFLNEYTNPYSAAVFKNTTAEHIESGIRKILAISDGNIADIVAKHGPTNPGLQKELVDNLVARKAYLLKKYPNAGLSIEEAAKIKAAADKLAKAEAAKAKKLADITDKERVAAMMKAREHAPVQSVYNTNAFDYMDKSSVKYITKLKNTLAPEEFSKIEALVNQVMSESAIGIRFQFGANKPRTVKGVTEKGKLLNQFQLGKKANSGGSNCPYKGGSRDDWEDNYTDGAYHKNPEYDKIDSSEYFDGTSVAEERPTYGFIYRDGAKTESASQYGNVIAVFGDDVKSVTTMTPKNSSGIGRSDAKANNGSIGSFMNPGPVYKNIIDRKAKDIESAWRAVERESSYSEVQVHSVGGVEIARAKAFLIDKDAVRYHCSDHGELDLVIKQVQILSKKYQVPWGYTGKPLVGIAK